MLTGTSAGDVRSIDGTDNNPLHAIGCDGDQYLQEGPASYGGPGFFTGR